MGRSHALSGAAVWLGGCAGLVMEHAARPGWVTVLGGAVVCAGAALLPDIDHPNSRITHAGGAVTEALCWVVRRGGHRGPTHYLSSGVLAGAVAGGLAALLSPVLWWIGLAVGAGWVAHILGDGCTEGGVPLWGPWDRRQRWVLWELLRFKTGDRGCRVELWFVRPMLMLVVAAEVCVLLGGAL